MAKKETYYKLSNEKASLFACTKTGLKVTQFHPGKATEISKKMKAALRHGHIIKISESEYDSMLDKTKNMGNKPTSESKIVLEVDEREDLLNRLRALELSKSEFTKISKKNNEALLEYLELNEEPEDEEEEDEDEEDGEDEDEDDK